LPHTLSLPPGEGLDNFPLESNADALVVHHLLLDFGECILIQVPTDEGYRNFIVDCGSPTKKIIDYMETFGINELHYVVCSHAHDDHCYHFTEVLAQKMSTDKTTPPEIWLPEYNHENVVKNYSTLWKFARNRNPLKKDLRKFPEDFSSTTPTYHRRFQKTINQVPCPIDFTVVAPINGFRDMFRKRVEHPEPGEDPFTCEGFENFHVNNTSLVINVAYLGKQILLTGDCETRSWRATFRQITGNPARNSLLGCNALKLPHHGSVPAIPIYPGRTRERLSRPFLRDFRCFMRPPPLPPPFFAVVTRGPANHIIDWPRMTMKLDALGVMEIYTWTETKPHPESYIFEITPLINSEKADESTFISFLCYILNNPEKDYGFSKNPHGYYTKRGKHLENRPNGAPT
jgi:hypothetical protein